MPLSSSPQENSPALQRVDIAAPENGSSERPPSPSSRFRVPIFHNGIFWAASPALALFALALLSSNRPLPEPVGKMAATDQSVISAENWVVPASQTIRISRQAAGDYTVLRGRLESTGGESISSSASGEVSQVLVRPGQNIRAGQQIAILTVGVAPSSERVETSSPLEHWQKRAETEQIRAAQQQEKLEKRIESANTELSRAKQRVTAAQQRVTEARRLIARLQNGEEVRGEETPEPTATPRSTPARDNSAAYAAALRESQKLQAEAEAAEAKAKAALKAAGAAESAANSKQQKVQSALAAVKSSEKATPATPPAEGESSDGKATKAPVESSRASENPANSKAVVAARVEAAEASSRAADLRREAERLEKRADTARDKANDAARRATRNLQIFDAESQRSVQAAASPKRVAKRSSEKMTITQAAKIARAAMDESDAAIKDAERIRRLVESYSRPVKTTRQRFDQATQKLQEAQEHIWDSAPTMRTTTRAIVAPRSGVVTWVAPLARVVHPGDAVAGIGRPDRLEVVVEDKSDAWKSLKPNGRVLALVQRMRTSDAAGGPARSTPAGAVSGGAAATPVVAMPSEESGINIPTLARVLAVVPPTRKYARARIRIAVHNPPEQDGNNRNGLSPRAFSAGMPVFFSLAQPTKQTAIRVPTAAVRREPNGKTFVAVLSPVENQAQDRLADQCRVEWREVLLAPGDGLTNLVKTGLKEGERVALRPDALYDFTLAYGSQATVSVEQI